MITVAALDQHHGFFDPTQAAQSSRGTKTILGYLCVFYFTNITANSPDNGESGPPSAGEHTIMPPSCPNVQTTDMDTYMDEIRRVLDQMNVNESENILDKFENEQKGNLGSSTERFSSNSYDNLSSIAMQRGASQDSDISSTSSHISMKDLRDNLEVICSLGEGASGEVAKACIKTTGQIIARKVCNTMLMVRLLLPLLILRSTVSYYVN